MIHITLAALTFDLQGHMQFFASPGTNIFTVSRRVNRQQTLDGGAEIVDRTFSHGDRTFNIVATMTRDEHAQARGIMENNSIIRTANPDGNFLGVISNMTLTDDGETEMQILIKDIF